MFVVVVSTLVAYLGGPEFKFRHAHRISWQVILSLSRHMLWW